MDGKINKEGYDSLEDVITRELIPLNLIDFKTKLHQGILVLDTRPASIFPNGFIPGSLFIGLEDRFEEWAGTFLPFNQPVVSITEPGKEEETIIKLARIGYENVEGYLDGGFETWQKVGEEIDMIIEVDADELSMDIPFDENLLVLDVRRENEFAVCHVKQALNLPLGSMRDVVQIAQLEENRNIYIHCGNGCRSLIAASLLKKEGYE